MKLLVVEHEHRLAQAIKQGLQDEGYAVTAVHDAAAGYRAAAASPAYDLVIVDTVDIVRRLRADGNHVPVLMLVGEGQAHLASDGADDHLAKPFSFDALLARVHALLRRPQQAFSQTLMVGDLLLDPINKRVERAGQFIRLTAKEFAILEYFMRHPGRVLSKRNIISHVWQFGADVPPNNVEVFITFLRAKIDKPFDKPLLRTVRGFGYTLSTDG